MLTDALIRSVVRATDADPEDAISHNLYRLRTELRHTGVDERIVQYITSTAERSLRLPTMAQVLQFFTAAADEGDGTAQAAVGRLREIPEDEPLLVGVAFHQAFEGYKDVLLGQGLGDLLQQTALILTAGMTSTEKSPVTGRYEPVTRRGPHEALQHLTRGASSLKVSMRQGFSDGDLRDGVEEMHAYLAKRASRGTGVLTGISMIDKVHGGLQPGELALVMGFPGHMKTTFCLNWLYHVAVMQGRNAAIVSLEVSVDKLRTILFVMHAAHPRFAHHGVVIDYDKVSNNVLSERERVVWAEVCEDFRSNADYGRILYKEPTSAVTIDEIHAWAELRDHQTPLSMLVVDYLGLVDPDMKVFDRQQAGSGLNRVIRQTKLMAMSFAGRGIAVASPHQANREGYADAEKNGGRYRLSALANANEAERSTDVVYYTYLDDNLRATNELAMGNLKNRDGRVFTDQIRVFADPSTRLIRDTSAYDRASGLTPLP